SAAGFAPGSEYPPGRRGRQALREALNGPDRRWIRPFHVIDGDQDRRSARSHLEQLGELLQEPEPLVAGTFECPQFLPAEDRRRSRSEGGEQRGQRDEGLHLI